MKPQRKRPDKGACEHWPSLKYRYVRARPTSKAELLKKTIRDLASSDLDVLSIAVSNAAYFLRIVLEHKPSMRRIETAEQRSEKFPWRRFDLARDYWLQCRIFGSRRHKDALKSVRDAWSISDKSIYAANTKFQWQVYTELNRLRNIAMKDHGMTEREAFEAMSKDIRAHWGLTKRRANY